jgi:endonuclease YncB( thermonuclease family)
MWQTSFMKISLPYLLLLLNFAVCNATAAHLLEGKVVSVADGDTVTVLDDQKEQHKIRLLGIDAPEKSQAFGEKSKQSLRDMVHGKRVQVTYAKRDKYGRIVGKVMLDDEDICHQQIKRGLAWHYKKYQNEQTPEDRDTYSESENAARSQKLGLWTDAQPLAPWDFRKGK